VKILITGPPGVGKTTLVREIIAIKPDIFSGFITEEMRDKIGERIGFKVANLRGEERILASKDSDSPKRVGKYGVDVRSFEELVIPILESATKDKRILVIDEIGKMELISHRFRELVWEIFLSQVRVLATIKLSPDPFVDNLKRCHDAQLFNLRRSNYNEVKQKIISLLGL